MKKETCVNCGHKIGKLERAYVYMDNVVCEICYEK